MAPPLVGEVGCHKSLLFHHALGDETDAVVNVRRKNFNLRSRPYLFLLLYILRIFPRTIVLVCFLCAGRHLLKPTLFTNLQFAIFILTILC